jgi:REP element-mobilizing transposase RayT
MPRFARLNYPGGVFHVIGRCLNDQFFIECAKDRTKYLALLEEASKKCDARVIAYCLMSNHIHLVVRAGEDPLSKLVSSVHTGFGVWKNLQLKRHGPLFSGRFKSPLVDQDQYLLEVVRYVHNNPVRAGVTTWAGNCDWSSHGVYLGLQATPPWMEPDLVLSRFSKDPVRAREAFDLFVREGAAEQRRPELVGCGMDAAARATAGDVGDAWRLSQAIVGSQDFARRVFEESSRRDGFSGHTRTRRFPRRPTAASLILLVCEALELDPREFIDHPRNPRPFLARQILVWLWVRAFKGTQADLARALCCSSARISKWYSEAAKNQVDIAGTVAAILDRLPVDAGLAETGKPVPVQFRLLLDLEGGGDWLGRAPDERWEN